MKLELVFSALGAALFSTVVWLSAASVRERRGASSLDEDSSFRCLVWPLAMGAFAIAFLAGWAVREPDPADERISFGLGAAAMAAGVVMLRAIVRAIVSLHLATRHRASVVTVGILRCHPLVSPMFQRSASVGVLAAVLAHEAAHARARDPLRIWLAQLAADLQWPIPGARRRLKAWLLALEVRRDDEALAAGASPLALAEGILLAAQLDQGTALPSAAATGDGSALALRVRRLLAAEAGCPAPLVEKRSRFVWHAWAAATLPAAVCLGARYGDALLALLPGIAR